jgi:hypothetical protein
MLKKELRYGVIKTTSLFFPELRNDEESFVMLFVPPLSHQKLQNRQELQALQGGQGQFC